MISKQKIKDLVKPLIGYKFTFYFFENLFLFSLLGMNYGGGRVNNSGEKTLLKKLSKDNKDNRLIFFDVGANEGHYSELIKSLFPNCIVHAFEPSRTTALIYKNNTNRFSDIILNNYGLGAEPANRILYHIDGQTGMASLYNRELPDSYVNTHSENVVIQSLDNYCIENSIQDIFFLKLDIEGSELDCLNGAQRMISQGRIKFIQFEFGGCNIDSRTYFKDFWLLLSEKYHFYRMLKNGLRKISVYNETHEIFITTNFLLELKEV